MDQSELKHAIRVNEGAGFIKFYLWLWEADRAQINFCKLFWGYVFAAPALVLRGLLGLAEGIGWTAVMVLAGVRFAAGHLGRAALWLANLEVFPKPPPSVRQEAERCFECGGLMAPGDAPWDQHLPVCSSWRPAPRPAPLKEPWRPMQYTLGSIENYGTRGIMHTREALRPVNTQIKRVKVVAGKSTVRALEGAGAVISSKLTHRLLFVLGGLVGAACVALAAYVLAPLMLSAFVTSVEATGWLCAWLFSNVLLSPEMLWTAVGASSLCVLVIISRIMAPYAVVVTRATGRAVAHPVIGRALLGIGGLVGVGLVVIGAKYASMPVVVALKATVAAVGIAISATIGGIVWIVLTLVHNSTVLLSFFAMCGLIVLIMVAWVAVTTGLIALLLNHLLKPVAQVGVNYVAAPSARVIEGGFKGFFRAMHIGYYAVKTSTCPRIELEERPDYEKIERVERETGIV